MLKNLNYNLMEEIVTLSKALYRYDCYAEDARAESGGCEQCSDIWAQMKRRHEQDLSTLLEQLKRHIDDGLFFVK